MARATFTLRIQIPERGEINPNVYDEILDVMEQHEEDELPATLRWLGGVTSEAEDALNSLLPEGFYCKIEGGEIQ
jgi:hypothetical protein